MGVGRTQETERAGVSGEGGVETIEGKEKSETEKKKSRI